MTLDASDYPASPYPGLRPEHSYIQTGTDVIRLDAADKIEKWRVGGMGLDDWLLDHEAPPMVDRVPLLSYGSNACPSKLVRLRQRFAMPGPVVMSRCTVDGLAAAWCDGERGSGSIPATLAVSAGREQHFLWWVAPDQWNALDDCEGRSGRWYDLIQLSGPALVLHENNALIEQVFVYVGGRPERYPLADSVGRLILVRDHSQAAAAHLRQRLRWFEQPTPGPLGRPVVGHPAPVGPAGVA